jgi:WD40 repeat protein
MTLQAILTLPETGNLIERLSTNDFNGSHIDFDMQILNDLNLYGSIRDVAQFLEAFMNITQNSISSADFSNNVDKINQYSEIHATCQNVTNPLYLQLMAKWVDNKNLLMPGIWSYENLELIPFDTYVEQADMDNINKVLEVVIPPMGSNTLLGVQVFSRMMQMLPLNSAEWNI